jgi:DNA processing protein
MLSQYNTIPPSDRNYPDGLQGILDNTMLYSIGNVELLNRSGIGICGSRDASPEALDWAYLLGKEAARRNIPIVSGYARGVDRQAHKGALEANGSTIAVLPEGIEGFSIRRELVSHVDLGNNFLAVSMFEPSARWSSWRAMTRNQLIVGLSSSLVVVEAREKGGTIDAARKCLKQGKKLWAVEYPKESSGGAGNRLLLNNASAIALNPDSVEQVFSQANISGEEPSQQLAMSIEV